MFQPRWIVVLIVSVALTVSPLVAVTVVPVDATSPTDDSYISPNGGDTDPRSPLPGVDIRVDRSPDRYSPGTVEANSINSSVDPYTPRAHTVGYNFVSDFAIPGWRTCSCDYSRQYQAPADTSLADIDPAELPGEGTPDTPYVITNASELQAMEDDLNAAYRLGADVNASDTVGWHGGAGFDPIGNGSQRFNGAFDGAGYTITELHVNRSTADYVGLFSTVADSGIIGNVTLTEVVIDGSDRVGGLVGDNRGTVRNGSATGTVDGSLLVGGLVGFNSEEGTVRNASASGAVDGSNFVGGLVGRNDGTVRNVSATGAVTGSSDVGGLVGNNQGTVRSASATGAVDGSTGVGGLVGDSGGTVGNAFATGAIDGSKYVGGLVGDNGGTVRSASATGAIDGSTGVGGLVGRNDGTVRNASATGAVTGSVLVGGLVGWNGVFNGGTVRNAFATGAVTGSNQVGGLVGQNGGLSEGTVRKSFATGAVNGSDRVGGLVGFNRGGAVKNAFATGAVTGSKGVGGLVGDNRGTVRSTFATGAVDGSNQVGGLVGTNDDGSVSESYWNVKTTGQPTSSGGIGLTTAQMTGNAARTHMTGLAFGTVWQTRIYEYPVLRTQPTDPTEPIRPETRTDAGQRTDETGTPGQATFALVIGAAIAGIGGAGYILKRRLDSEDDEQ